jgi:hypothetical protein
MLPFSFPVCNSKGHSTRKLCGAPVYVDIKFENIRAEEIACFDEFSLAKSYNVGTCTIL